MANNDLLFIAPDVSGAAKIKARVRRLLKKEPVRLPIKCLREETAAGGETIYRVVHGTYPEGEKPARENIQISEATATRLRRLPDGRFLRFRPRPFYGDIDPQTKQLKPEVMVLQPKAADDTGDERPGIPAGWTLKVTRNPRAGIDLVVPDGVLDGKGAFNGEITGIGPGRQVVVKPAP